MVNAVDEPTVAKPARRREEPASYEYKVLTRADKAFSGAVDATGIARVLNYYGARGWRVCEMAAASFTTLLGGRDEIIVVLERPAR